jgi:predicted AAA+ superfamily ATPase
MLERTIKSFIERTSKGFSVLLLSGMRQIGKTTLLQGIAEPARKYVSLDVLEDRMLAKSDPALFIVKYSPPVIIDEVQYAPELFTQIKIYVDNHKQKGLFWLTGSQKFRLMKGIQESLAGRVAIVDMLGLSYKELTNRPFENEPFCPSLDMMRNEPPIQLTVLDVYKRIWNGSFPELLLNPDIERGTFYKSYLQTYLERDIKDFHGISDDLKFYDFIRVAAARTGNLINFADLARDADIDVRTAKLWLSMLERSGVIKILEPYSANITKRIVKTPKLYFLDTGLCAYLTKWDSPESLEAGAMSGNILETYILGEILKSYWHNGKEENIYFYRDSNQKEIDFVIEKNMTLYPIEVKKTGSPSKTDISAFESLKQTKKQIGAGAIICFYPNFMPINKEVISIPVWAI